MFVVNGAVYAASAPIWGHLCDKVLPPVAVTCIGSALITVSFLFIGPVPFIPLETSLNLCIAMLVVHGVGFAAQLVAGFSSAHRQALFNGFDDNINTYALVSSLWTATFALGAFIGPTVAGLLVNYYNFPVASIFVVIMQLTVFILTLFSVCRVWPRLKQGNKSDILLKFRGRPSVRNFSCSNHATFQKFGFLLQH